MARYTTIVVGTDGSETSFAAVDRAAEVARDEDAKLVIVCAFHAPKPDELVHTADVLGEDATYVLRMGPADEILHEATLRAKLVGATDIDTVAFGGKPADVLRQAAVEFGADLLVVGNRGLNTLAGRVVGSVPLDILRHAPVDVLVVHTT